jgi:hypothetical protein
MRFCTRCAGLMRPTENLRVMRLEFRCLSCHKTTIAAPNEHCVARRNIHTSAVSTGSKAHAQLMVLEKMFDEDDADTTDKNDEEEDNNSRIDGIPKNLVLCPEKTSEFHAVPFECDDALPRLLELLCPLCFGTNEKRRDMLLITLDGFQRYAYCVRTRKFMQLESAQRVSETLANKTHFQVSSSSSPSSPSSATGR